jgi:ribonuclease HII
MTPPGARAPSPASDTTRTKGIKTAAGRPRAPGFSRKEAARLAAMLRIERQLTTQGYALIAGLDEAGRGPLAGPVCAAAVIFAPGTRIARVNDSKQVSPEVREELFGEIMAKARAVGVGLADAEEIDAINILNATKLAMRRALHGLRETPDYLILDAITLKDFTQPQMPLVKGDARCFSIAAASIIAKVTRDRLMVRYAEEFPQYGFERHKGYGTDLHLKNIIEHGPSSIHRRTFFDPGMFSRPLVLSAKCNSLLEELTRGLRPDPVLQMIDTLRGYLPGLEIRQLVKTVESLEAL